MNLFGRHRKRATISIDEAASLLAETINSDIPADMTSKLEREDAEAIVRLLKWTRACIAIRWLRAIESRTKDKRTWADVLEHLEREIFPADQDKGLKSVILVNNLMPVLAEHQRLSTQEESIETDFSEYRIWAQSWVSLICEDKTYAEQIGRQFSFHLLAFTTDEVMRFANLLTEISAKLSGQA